MHDLWAIIYTTQCIKALLSETVLLAACYVHSRYQKNNCGHSNVPFSGLIISDKAVSPYNSVSNMLATIILTRSGSHIAYLSAAASGVRYLASKMCQIKLEVRQYPRYINFLMTRSLQSSFISLFWAGYLNHFCIQRGIKRQLGCFLNFLPSYCKLQTINFSLLHMTNKIGFLFIAQISKHTPLWIRKFNKKFLFMK